MRVHSSGGFDSLTAKKDLADRIRRIGNPAVILHLGDRDPSGVSIFDSVAEDAAAFVAEDRPWGTVDVTFERIALTAEQVWRYDLPTAPAKATDTRSKSWTGGTCQLEALPPNVIADIQRGSIRRHIDGYQFLAALQAEEEDLAVIDLRLLPAPGDDRDA